MTKDQVNALVHGYLGRAKLDWERSPDGQRYQVDQGSTAVFITLYPYRQHVIVHLKATVLQDVRADAPVDILSVLNGRLPFAKFCFYPDERMVTLEYELLGGTMDEDEFFLALDAVASTADDWDEQLRDQYQFGGRVWRQAGGSTTSTQ